MTGAEFVANIGIVFRPRIDILDQQRDRRAGGHLLRQALVLEHAGQDADLVRLFPLGDEFRLSGFAPVEIALNVGFGKRDTRRATVHHAA